MMGLIIAMHVIVCALLIVVILIQAGRGGGLVESFSSVESMFGPKTNTFLTRTTAILSIMFFVTCVSLALLSAKQSRSLLKGLKPQTKTEQTQTQVPQKVETQNSAEQKNSQEAPKTE